MNISKVESHKNEIFIYNNYNYIFTSNDKHIFLFFKIKILIHKAQDKTLFNIDYLHLRLSPIFINLKFSFLVIFKLKNLKFSFNSNNKIRFISTIKLINTHYLPLI